MADVLEQTGTTEATPAPVVAEAVTPVEETSIDAHSAAFGRESERREPEQTQQPPAQTDKPRERHRAQGQRATSEDVPRIADLTKKWRGEESRANKLEEEIKALRAAQIAAPAQSVSTARTAATGAASDQKPAGKPSWKDFEDQIGTNYQTWGEAQDAYDDARHDWRSQAKQAEQKAAADQSANTERQQQSRARLESHLTKLQTFVKDHPDFQQKQDAIGNVNIPPLLWEAVLSDDKSPDILYSLLSDPVYFDEMLLLSDGKEVTDASVATLRRRLSAQLTRTQAAATGSAAAMPSTSWTARPPNPVRTSPLKTGDEPPGEGSSIADHAKYYSPKSKR